MKNFLINIIIVIIIAILALIVFRKCSTENFQTIIKDLKAKAEIEQFLKKQAEDKIIILQNKIHQDSLTIVNIKTQINVRNKEINQNILKDSANAIIEYRRGLQDNGWQPDSAPQLTLREIGIGALALAKIPKLELTINYQDSTIIKLRKIITEDKYIKTSYQSLIKIKDLELSQYKIALQTAEAWYNSKPFWFALGGVSVLIITKLIAIQLSDK